MDPYTQAAVSIIKGQMEIIGPIAIDQAKRVPGLKIASPTQIELIGDKKQVLNGLVGVFAELFGNASVQVCKQAFNPYRNMIPVDQIPDILKS